MQQSRSNPDISSIGTTKGGWLIIRRRPSFAVVSFSTAWRLSCVCAFASCWSVALRPALSFFNMRGTASP